MSPQKNELNTKRKSERLGILLSMLSNVFFVTLELWISYLSHSQAVLIDGIFDGCETLLLIFSLWLMKYLYQPISEKRPIGYSNLEPFYMILKGLLFFIVAVMMAVSSIRSLFTEGNQVNINFVFDFEMIAAAYGVAAYFILRRINKKARSQILYLEVKEWGFDIFSSLGTGVAFLLAYWAQFSPLRFLATYCDPIIALVVVAYTLPVPLKAVKSGFEELFFLSPKEEIIEKVKAVGVQVAGDHGIQEDRLDFDVVKTGRRLWISIYIRIDEDFIDVSLFRTIHAELVSRYAPLADMVDVDVIPDIEADS